MGIKGLNELQPRLPRRFAIHSNGLLPAELLVFEERERSTERCREATVRRARRPNLVAAVAARLRSIY